MITAEQAKKLAGECCTWNVVARQLEYVYNKIEGEAKLGKSKCRWILPSEFRKSEINYLKEQLRHRGFELDCSREICNILW